MGKGKVTTFCNGVCPWAVERAKEASTWRGLAVLGSAFGVFANPEQAHVIIGAVAGLFGAVDVVKSERE